VRFEACGGIELTSLKPQASSLILHIQRDINTEPRQVRHEVENVTFDTAKTVQWKDNPRQHGDADRLLQIALRHARDVYSRRGQHLLLTRLV
jgi:hypothetical protein